jgi:uncharacterized small protein (DUF1192 family)
MAEDDESPRIKPATDRLGRPLEGVSVADLEAYVTALEAEIARVRAEIERRGAHHAAAEALFKRRDGPEEA